ncbi:GAF and ANTAR domain-containing protein [Luteipulveratus halotolerans]|uniref:ANTAR domain-containing protein n=1 Tax=Luteipulveratus halotolerans TaxID=1631356 RepID=A0A0L6CLS2_9MICO|nr:GAF and ANTAR domain-containing protein [Luteipulveratus halotolerans]KNX38684.1 hypothetical protein VV01_18510 [Luteipulveratus halotolerans]
MSDNAQANDVADLAEDLHAAPTSVTTAEQVVAFACRELGADYGGVTLVRKGGRLETVAPSDPIVARADALQVELDEGPCHDSAEFQDAFVTPDMSRETRWPRWAPRAVELGIHGALASSLAGVDGRRVGSLNLFWREPHAITSDDIAYASIFTRHAAIAIESAQTQEGLRTALDARKLIGQAQGILMERHGLTGDQAFDVLRRYSQDHNIKLREVAEQLVETRALPGDGSHS